MRWKYLIRLLWTKIKPTVAMLFRLPSIRWPFHSLTALMSLIWVLVVIKLYLYYTTRVDLSNILQTDKCPACYGLDLCSEFMSGEFSIGGYDAWQVFGNMFSSKNVFFAQSNIHGNVVIKKLAHDWELEAFDREACMLLGGTSHCDDFRGLSHLPMMQQKITSMVELIEPGKLSGRLGLTVCPYSRPIHLLCEGFFTDKNHQPIHEGMAMAFVWTLLNVNPEPIVMKFLNRESSQWPVPKYIGSCGRSTVQSYEGVSLTNMLDYSWLERARISHHLLNAVDRFTFNHTRFRFYLLDISLDNIVIDYPPSDHRPIFVDLENVIVLDKAAQFMPGSETLTHRSETFDCADCVAFDSEDVCRYSLSDHNHYFMCRILSEEFLHSVPEYVLQMFPNIYAIIKKCVEPDPGCPDRIEAATYLNKELLRILNFFSVPIN